MLWLLWYYARCFLARCVGFSGEIPMVDAKAEIPFVSFSADHGDRLSGRSPFGGCQSFARLPPYHESQ